MNSEVYERNIICKLYWNKKLHHYLDDMLPGIFANPKYRLIIAIMKRMKAEKVEIISESIFLYQTNKNVIRFKRKYKIKDISQEEIDDVVRDVTIDHSANLFDEAYKELHDLAYFRLVEEGLQDIQYELGYKNRFNINSRIRGMQKIYEVIYRSKLKNRKDGISSAAAFINKKDSYIRFSSDNMTNSLGGWSRGFVGSVIARPSHNKSTFMTNEARFLTKSGILDRVDVISPEEPSEIFWSRIFAAELKVSIRDMRVGNVRISEEDVKKIKNLYEDKIIFHEIVTYSDLIDLLFSLDRKTEFIYIDHINAIAYPKGDMFGGIVNLVNRQKEFLKENKDTVIVNLSQVNTKEMKRKGRLFPAKEDAYCSSVLEMASREFLSFYYPYKDATDKELYVNFTGKPTPKQDFVQVSIEKNSFGQVGLLDLHYLYQYGIFEDRDVPKIILPEENKQETLWNLS